MNTAAICAKNPENKVFIYKTFNKKVHVFAIKTINLFIFKVGNFYKWIMGLVNQFGNANK